MFICVWIEHRGKKKRLEIPAIDYMEFHVKEIVFLLRSFLLNKN